MDDIDFRELVRGELARRKLSVRWLAEHKQATWSPETIYRFLRPKSDTNIGTSHMARVMSILGLHVQPVA